MTLFQSIVGVIFSMGFLILLFLLIGYVSLPIFLIIIAVGLFKFFRAQPNETQRFQSTEYPAMRRRDDKVIDVDYTELP